MAQKITQTQQLNTLSTQANAGTAGGTMSYINLGGIKLLFVTGATVNTAAGTLEFTFTLPTSFFSTTPVVTVSAFPVSVDVSQRANVSAASSSSIAVYITSTNTATCKINLIAIGN